MQAPKRAVPKDSETAEIEYRHGVALRLDAALAGYNAKRGRGDRLTQGELGRRVAVALGKRPVPQATVSRWLSGDTLPDNPTLAVLAELLEVNAGWLAFGASED